MKKFFVTILSIIYLTTTTGFTLNMHYCMGKQVDLAPSATTDKCSNCGMDKSVAKDNGCCKDEHKQIKLDSDQKTGAIALKFLQFAPVVLPHSFIEVPINIPTSIPEENPTSHAPPRSSGIAYYISNCVFLI